MSDEDRRRRVRSNGEGAVREDKRNKRWVGSITLGWEPTAEIDDAGDEVMKQRRKWVSGKTKREVLDKLDELRRDISRGADLSRADMTVAAYLNDWLERVLPGSVADATEAQYRDVVHRLLIPRIGECKLSKLSARDVSGMLLDMAKPTETRPSGYSANSRRLARSILRRALRLAQAEGLVTQNVAALANPVKADQIDGRAMTPDQAKRFLASIRGHADEAAFVLMLTCGLRVSELLGLAWDCIELDGDAPRLMVRRGLKRIKGKGLVLSDVKTKKSKRVVHLIPTAVTALRAHKARLAAAKLARGSSWPDLCYGIDLVFRSPVGTPMDPKRYSVSLSDATKAAGLDHWNPHALRHSAASLLIDQGLPLEIVSEMLGHSSITITKDVYGHLYDRARSQAAAAMQRALG
ncbi:tyrosine-type recombinase/integrase [Desertimonas flava]|uniref:tyrosine-type recombinase/integrase n=1 Tax=Desertimonas flava TaxID=2064846 RepID=UPI0013C44FDF|nr:site-specific integrase [Desertimonas flava]